MISLLLSIDVADESMSSSVIVCLPFQTTQVCKTHHKVLSDHLLH